MAHHDQVRTYLAADSVVFRKTNERFGGLSNMAPGFPLFLNGIRIYTSEALYQACRFPHLPDVQRLIIDQRSPMTAKMRSKPYRKESRSDWYQIRVDIMRWCLRIKLAQNWEKFSNLLLATDNRPIVEESRKDDFWGAKPLDDGTLLGKNVLGRLLMELREGVRGPDRDSLREIVPPKIPNLLLLGKPIISIEEHSNEVILQPELAPVAITTHIKTKPATNEWSNSMIPRECKRLAEVDFPIAVVSKHSAREKSIRHGHPSTLHLWWARRPLAACRSMLMALLLPDPWDPNCPPEFKTKARETLLKMTSRPSSWNELVQTDEGLRKVLLTFIGDFANWDLSKDPEYLNTSRALVKAAHPEEAPLVVDPFAGGGSIPLEALRLGCETFASDLNPVACLILKVMLENIPRHGPELAEELRRVGKEIKEKAEKELAPLYPKTPIIPDNLKNGSFILLTKKDNGFEYTAVGDVEKHLLETQKEYSHYLQIPNGAEHGFQRELASRDWKQIEKAGAKPLDLKWEFPIAYLWARTVKCESPNCGAEIPLMRSFWLCKKPNKKRALRYKVARPGSGPPSAEFDIFEPETDKDVHGGTVTRAKATCLCCGMVLPPVRTKAQLSEQHGGADVVFDAEGKRIGGARMLAAVTLRPGETGRHYRIPNKDDYQAVGKAQKRLNEIVDKWEHGGKKGLCPVPDEPTPAGGGSGAGRAFSVQKYGMMEFGDLFTARQKMALVTYSHKALESNGHIGECNDLLAIAVARVADATASLTTWLASGEEVKHVFSRQALPIVWDFGETNPTSEVSRSWNSAIDAIHKVLMALTSAKLTVGQVQQADSCQSPLPDAVAAVWFTDPPYYDAIPYSDLSDYFLVWLKRTLPGLSFLHDPFDDSNPLSPKAREIVQDETKEFGGKPKDRSFFEERMAEAFAEGRRVLLDDGIGSVVFAHKTTEGWEALLSGMIRGGWTITASWPIVTEAGNRLRAFESAALATSVHLVCRPRPEDAPIGDWGNVLRELPDRVGNWMEYLQGEGVRGADLVFACIGPALEIFSRYSKVVDPEEREIPLGGDPGATEPHKRGFLAYVWETVGRIALEQILGTAEARARNGMAGVLEEDARMTALFLWTLQATNGQNDSEGEPDEDAEDNSDIGDDEGAAPKAKTKGYSLVFDVVRRFAQPLGIELPKWEGRIIETKKGVVRLMAISERAKQLFGEGGSEAIADLIEHDPSRPIQMALFAEMEGERAPTIRGGRGRRSVSVDPTAIEGAAMREATTLDRVHAAMLLQASGQANALRALIKAEQDRSPDFLRLANALSTLYPKGSEEKRLLEAMLMAAPR